MNQIKDGFINNLVPNEFFLSQNYPNPFKDKTVIKYCIAYTTKVELSVFNSDEKLIKILADKEQNAGSYEVEFNADLLPEGGYFYQLKAGEFIQTKKMVLQK